MDYHYYIDHVWSWDLFAVGVTIVGSQGGDHGVVPVAGLTREGFHMLLRNRLHDPESLIRAGMLSLRRSIIAQRFIHPPADFWQGFVAGLSGVLIGLSIVFNIRGLVLHRQRRANGE